MNKKEQVMTELWDLFIKIKWLDGIKMKVGLNGYYPSEIHCVEYIGENIDANVKKLAEAFNMTTSAISKLTKKMMKKGLIESYQKPDNKKEIYFRLTAQGKAINNIHEDLHQEYEARDKIVFAQITQEQYDAILCFAKMYNKHLDTEIEKLDMDITPRGPERI